MLLSSLLSSGAGEKALTPTRVSHDLRSSGEDLVVVESPTAFRMICRALRGHRSRMSKPPITLYRTLGRRNRCLHSRPVIVLLLLSAWFAVADSSASAQAPTPVAQAGDDGSAAKTSGATDSDAYERLILTALSAYERGQWAKALSEFEQAHRLKPSARTWRTIGMSAYNLGDFPRSIAALEQALSDARRPLDAEHRTQVQQLLERAYHEVARVDLLTTPEPDEVRINGAIPFRARSGALLLPPGKHELTVTKRGYEPVRYTVSAFAGQHSQVTVYLPRAADGATDGAADGAPKVATQDAAPAAGAAAVDTQATNWQRTAGIVALATGATSLLASSITAVLALDRRAPLGRNCPNNECPPSQHGELAVYDRFKSVSTITFYGGLLAGAAGLTLLLIGPQDDAPAQPAKAELDLGPLGVRVRGTL